MIRTTILAASLLSFGTPAYAVTLTVQGVLTNQQTCTPVAGCVSDLLATPKLFSESFDFSGVQGDFTDVVWEGIVNYRMGKISLIRAYKPHPDGIFAFAAGEFGGASAFGFRYNPGLETHIFGRSYGYTEGGYITRLMLDGKPVSFVPEPAWWVLFLVGFGAIGAALRLSRKSVCSKPSMLDDTRAVSDPARSGVQKLISADILSNLVRG